MNARRAPVLATLAALSATVAWSFDRVLTGSDWIVPLVGATVAAHALGALARHLGDGRAPILAPALAQLVGLGAFLAVMAGSLDPSEVLRTLERGWDVVVSRDVPLPDAVPVLALTGAVTWLAAAAADHLAFARQASIAALGPGIAVLIWITALGERDAPVYDLVAFGVAGAAFLAVQHQALLDRRRTRLGVRRLVDAPGVVALAVLSATVALGLGMVGASALPGGDEPLFQRGDDSGDDPGSSAYRTTVPPLLDVGDKLRRGDRVELFTVQAPSAEYWRITALDQYRGTGGGQWTLTAQGDAVARGLAGPEPAGGFVQEYRIGDLGERWMPAAFEAVSVSRSDTLVVRSSVTLVTGADSVSGLRYRVVSVLPTATPSAAEQQRTAAAPPAELRPYLAVPDDVPDVLASTARQVTAGLTTGYDRARALRDFFRDGSFTYDTSVDLGDDGAALAQFLTIRRGFCVQFASAYALMARSIGLPARVAVGFTPGTRDQAGTFHVTNWDAHAWPEVWLSGLGWTHVFDPTPPAERGGSDLPTEPPVARSGTSAPPATGPGATVTVPSAPAPTVAPDPGTGPEPGGVSVDPSSGSTGSDPFPWLLVLLVALPVLVAAPFVAVVALKAARRRRRRREVDPRRAVQSAWAEMLDELVDRRLRWPPSDTPRELATRLPREAAGAAESLRSLADAYGASAYGAAPTTEAEGRRAWRDRDAVVRALDASVPWRERLRTRLDPSSLWARPSGDAQRERAGWSSRRRSSTKV